MTADTPLRSAPRQRRPRTTLVILVVALAVTPLCVGFGFLLAGPQAYFLEALLSLTLSVLLLTLLGVILLLWSWRAGFPARFPAEGLALVIGCGGSLFLGLLLGIFVRPSALPQLAALAWGFGGFLLAGLLWCWRRWSMRRERQARATPPSEPTSVPGSSSLLSRRAVLGGLLGLGVAGGGIIWFVQALPLMGQNARACHYSQSSPSAASMRTSLKALFSQCQPSRLIAEKSPEKANSAVSSRFTGPLPKVAACSTACLSGARLSLPPHNELLKLIAEKSAGQMGTGTNGLVADHGFC
jgi:hypothetical protein